MGFKADRMIPTGRQKNVKVMLSVSQYESQILVATDIVARGIDIDESMVMNFDVPARRKITFTVSDGQRAQQSG